MNPLFEIEKSQVDELVEKDEALKQEQTPKTGSGEKNKPEEPVDKDKMLEIYDAIMFEGVYRENFPIGKRYTATFRSRTSGEDLKISLSMDRQKYETAMAFYNQSSLLTLAVSLEALGTKNFADMKDDAARLEAIKNLPSAVVVLLSEALNQFDAKVFRALDYGKENF